MSQSRSTRRDFARAWLALPVSFLLAACLGRRGGNGSESGGQSRESTGSPTEPPRSAGEQPGTLATPPAAQALAPTPACDDGDDDLTPPQMEGPFFTPDSPERTSLLEPGIAGTRLVVMGSVLSTACQPLAGALLDFWQCDDAGQYDNQGYRLRGHQFADDQGRYALETILPGLYPGRTRHIHVKVQAPNGPVLTTQQYFPDEPGNATDGLFQPELLMDVQDTADGKVATFNFVLNT